MINSNRPITAREYKLILNNEAFNGRENGIEEFIKAIEGRLRVLTKSDGEAHFVENQDDKKRNVWYLDTSDFRIRDNNFLLRIRKEKDDEYATSLKCRSPDRYVAASFDLSSTKKKVKNKFEEDIIEPFASNFSLSATFETKDEPDIESFGELTSIFPGLSVLNIDAGMILSKVNNFEAREFSCQLGKVEFGTEGSTHDMSLEFWYLPGEAKNESPIIVEFTFDYDAAEPGSLDNSKKGSLLEEFPISVVSKANAFYHLMQEIKYFRGSQTAKTKTQFAYDCARNI